MTHRNQNCLTERYSTAIVLVLWFARIVGRSTKRPVARQAGVDRMGLLRVHEPLGFTWLGDFPRG